MAAVEFTPAGGTDGGWARSAREVDETFATLAVPIQQLAARGHQTVAELSVEEHYLLGVRAAALWTMGRTDTAPLTDQVHPADGDSVVTVLAIAEDLMTSSETPSVVALADGIRAWLAWLIGVQDRVVLRAP
jgi:hypothetical protein